MEALKAALWYAKHGFGISPVWGVTEQGTCLCPKGTTCTQPGKHPASAHSLKDATTDPEKIRKFLSNKGTPNYSIDLPEGHVGIDVDGEDLLRWAELEKTLGPLPETLTQISGAGLHYIFQWPETYGPIPSRIQGCIVRHHQNGYFVGAGSHHASGRTYDIQQPLVMPVVFPKAWVETQKPFTNGAATIKVGGTQPEDVPEGHRHEFLRDRARTMRGAGMAYEDILEQCLKLNARFPVPKTREEVVRAVGDIEQFPVDALPGASLPSPEEVEAKARELESELPPVIHGATVPRPADIDDWLVEDLLRPKQLAVLAATEGVGKSNIRLELGIRYACAHGALFDTYPMGKAGTVLVFDEENGEREEFQREEAMLASLGLERAKHLISYWRVSHMGLDLEDSAYRVLFDGMLTQYAPQLVILDTAGSMVGEEHGKEFKGVISFLKRMKDKHECCIVLVVHLVKSPREGKAVGKKLERAITDVMGQWTRSADVLLLMSETDDDNVILWRVRKRVPRSDITLKRDDPTAPERWVRVDAKRMPPTVVAKEEFANILQAVGAGRGTWAQVTGYLASQGLPTPAKATLFRHLKAMAEQGLIERDPAGVISLTDVGRRALPARVSLKLVPAVSVSGLTPPTGGSETDETDNETGVRPSETHTQIDMRLE